jgi:hypothetical protein
VRREPDPADGELTLAILNVTGGEAAREAEPGHVALVRRLVFDALTPAQARALGEACRLVTERIDDDRAWKSTPPTRKGE